MVRKGKRRGRKKTEESGRRERMGDEGGEGGEGGVGRNVRAINVHQKAIKKRRANICPSPSC